MEEKLFNLTAVIDHFEGSLVGANDVSIIKYVNAFEELSRLSIILQSFRLQVFRQFFYFEHHIFGDNKFWFYFLKFCFWKRRDCGFKENFRCDIV